MNILIAERDVHGRRMLSRILAMEGYEVSVAGSGSHAMSLLREVKPSIILMNVFQCMHGSMTAPPGKVTVRRYGKPAPVLLVTCTEAEEKLEEFMAAPGVCGAPFDSLPPKMKSNVMNKIQEMCCALRQCSRLPSADGSFNGQSFVTLMERSPSLEM